MNYLMQCTKCKATAWIRGSFDESVNALSLFDEDPEWDDGDVDCEHDDLECIDEEADDSE